ncbi:MAG TPA: acyltransferase domain-containing protein [Bradyrhizobium sp.]|nr:acyltransferase domain-containing protein [Bradyrhizobium sp.]
MFSGQGSHYYQMGRDLFDHDALFRRNMLHMNEVAGDLLGLSLTDILYQNRKSDVFDRTLLSSSAIFAIEYALAQTLIGNGVEPALVLGASLGVYCSICVADCLKADKALATVIGQSRIFEERCEPGFMLALLASPRLYSDSPVLHRNSEIAALNYSGHFVISARQPDLQQIESFLRDREITYYRLPVSLPFHTRWTEPARSATLALFESLQFAPPQLSVVCCGQASPRDAITPAFLWASLRECIDFERTILRLELQGPHRYIDVGPMGTLATFLKYLLPPTSQSRVHSVMTPLGGDLKRLRELLTAARTSG